MWLSTRSVPGTPDGEAEHAVRAGRAPVPSGHQAGRGGGRKAGGERCGPPVAASPARVGAYGAAVGNWYQPSPSTSSTATRRTPASAGGQPEQVGRARARPSTAQHAGQHVGQAAAAVAPARPRSAAPAAPPDASVMPAGGRTGAAGRRCPGTADRAGQRPLQLDQGRRAARRRRRPAAGRPARVPRGSPRPRARRRRAARRRRRRRSGGAGCPAGRRAPSGSAASAAATSRWPFIARPSTAAARPATSTLAAPPGRSAAASAATTAPGRRPPPARRGRGPGRRWPARPARPARRRRPARRATRSATPGLGGPAGQRGERVRAGVDHGDPVPGLGQRHGETAGAAADVEHGELGVGRAGPARRRSTAQITAVRGVSGGPVEPASGACSTRSSLVTRRQPTPRVGRLPIVRRSGLPAAGRVAPRRGTGGRSATGPSVTCVLARLGVRCVGVQPRAQPGASGVGHATGVRAVHRHWSSPLPRAGRLCPRVHEVSRPAGPENRNVDHCRQRKSREAGVTGGVDRVQPVGDQVDHPLGRSSRPRTSSAALVRATRR